jgi:hypothetical protein
LDGIDLPALAARIRAIADDCFDLRAVDRLRSLADEIDRATSVPPIILTRRGERSRESDG